MPDDRLEKARFVRVSKTGDLVFSLGGREMAVSVDDTLERAILEAKQVRSEMRQAPQPHQQSTLPISQIQSLIRAGADPARVAEKYHLSEMLPWRHPKTAGCAPSANWWNARWPLRESAWNQ